MPEVDRNELLEEYKLLKEEILYFMRKDTTLLTLLFTGVASLLYFSIEHNVIEGCLISFLLIIPICSKMGYHRKQMAKISAYMIIFLEPYLDIKWETRNSKKKGRKSKRFSKAFRFSECIMTAIISDVAFVCILINQSIEEIKYKQVFVVAVLLIIVTSIVIALTFDIYKTKENRVMWIEQWEDLKRSTAQK